MKRGYLSRILGKMILLTMTTRKSSTMFSHVFTFAKPESVIGTNMYRFVATTLDCFTVLRQSLILTVLKRMRMSVI